MTLGFLMRLAISRVEFIKKITLKFLIRVSGQIQVLKISHPCLKSDSGQVNTAVILDDFFYKMRRLRRRTREGVEVWFH
jgi:hypothetical protein